MLCSGQSQLISEGKLWLCLFYGDKGVTIVACVGCWPWFCISIPSFVCHKLVLWSSWQYRTQLTSQSQFALSVERVRRQEMFLASEILTSSSSSSPSPSSSPSSDTMEQTMAQVCDARGTGVQRGQSQFSRVKRKIGANQCSFLQPPTETEEILVECDKETQNISLCKDTQYKNEIDKTDHFHLKHQRPAPYFHHMQPRSLENSWKSSRSFVSLSAAKKQHNGKDFRDKALHSPSGLHVTLSAQAAVEKDRNQGTPAAFMVIRRHGR